ncbi:MAG: AtpZ/AtpI family protein [Deltaproteobacteria bacterium]|nr:AtpZ/AtpI family protein [Deltaproteobacteria bacterium]MBW1827051.1 AtpZ/AtpI family protein [Deltaproteobacteria bacterium]MBW1969618.1 AtpZ/AtpI family protein [Deltaproteobacteria bacterium]MBW2155607.1 AtpZ/AtpI family protein [Deltaproteobacteria bacterium]MBW2198194.1 AtpZ/AtpI family protein [Deltaproteobacteria bacterium]
MMRQDALYKMPFNYKKNRPWIENLSIITQFGLTMVGCIFFCFFIGRYLDKFLGTKGIFVAIFTVLGVIGGGIVVYRQILEVTENKEENDNSGNGLS